MYKTVYCYNRGCQHKGYSDEVCNIDKTNCRIHDGQELLDGDCSDFLLSDNNGYTATDQEPTPNPPKDQTK